MLAYPHATKSITHSAMDGRHEDAIKTHTSVVAQLAGDRENRRLLDFQKRGPQRQFVEGGFRQVIPHKFMDLVYHVAQYTVSSTVASRPGQQAGRPAQWTFDGLKDVQEIELGGGFRQLKTTLRAANRIHHACSRQSLHDLGQMMFRRAELRGDLLCSKTFPTIPSQQRHGVQAE